MCTRPAKRPKRLKLTIGAALVAALFASTAQAGPVGQTWRAFPDPSAASRDYLGRAQVRAVIWYPAASGVTETDIAIGPPEARTFAGGKAAPEAPLARGGRKPLIVMSHGSGGTALQYGWLADALARQGYVVVAVDHPGASGGERATDPGTLLWWRRADDISAALDAVLKDPILGPRIDRRRIGMVGYSLGGATGLVLAGARPSLAAMQAACVTARNAACGMLGEAAPDMAKDRADRRIRAFALIAPGLVPMLDLAPAARPPMLILAGDADETAKPADNAVAVSRALGAQLEILDGVAHNDFLQPCTDVGRSRYADLCREPNARREATHAKAAGMVGAFFNNRLR
jgi:predicted dienelactone hydrolase